MHPITASNTLRVLSCPGHLSMPWRKDEPGEAAEMGAIVHEFLRDAVENGRDTALANLGRKGRAACGRIDVDAIVELIGGRELHCELAMELDVETLEARALLDAGGRNYPQESGRIYGTADLVIVDQDRVEVWDYKTGRHGSLDEASPQLLTLAAMACDIFGRPSALVGVMLLPDRGEHCADSAAIDTVDMAVHLGRLVVAHDSAKRNPDYKAPGEHCKYCPAIGCDIRAGV